MMNIAGLMHTEIELRLLIIIVFLLLCASYSSYVFVAELPAKSEKAASANLIVNNLPTGTKAVDVRALVSQHGKVFFVNSYSFCHMPNF